MRPARNLLLLIALGAVPIAFPVLAQPASDYPPPCDASKVTKADVDRAHTVFLSGKQFLEESNYDKAIGYFKDAYSIDCSVHAMLPIIATAYERKGDKAEAVRALEEYTKRAPNAPDHEVIERRIRNLKDQMAREQPTASAPSAAPSSAASASPSTAPSAEPAPTVSALPSAAVEAPPPASSEGHSALPWVVVGVGGVVAVTGAVLLGVGAGDISSASSQCTADRICPTQDVVNTGNTGRNLETFGGVGIGVGLAVAAAGLLWHFLEGPSERQSGAAAPGARVEPLVGPGYLGMGIAHW
jgi:tetratricopeptide (TPR) repeat protein